MGEEAEALVETQMQGYEDEIDMFIDIGLID
ncbi:Uncharacterized protein LEKG_0850 [Leuconostoc gasicomitatum KG16-1]|nr:Uncharacterized protein LEKG_0850 [Leuconostoc gasicomitatum KG16-1]